MNAIEVNNLTKVYRLYNSPRDRLREIISLNGKKHHHEFYALNDVSLNVEKGQTVGIIGQNGSGKSTLLKLICGVLQPTSGSVRANGRISALLELGAGFNPEFTGRENVYMNGALMGFSREEMEQRFPDIEAFAEIGEFIEQPVKTYSSGMQVRLAFAAAVNIDPEILVVDEALSVGDMFFQHKCIAKMESFLAEGKTVLLVTHDINLVKSSCSLVFLLNDGKILESGDPEYVTEQYLMLMRQKQTEYASSAFQVAKKTETKLPGAKVSFGSEAGQILHVTVLDKELQETAAFLAGDTIVIRIQAQVASDVKKPDITFVLRDDRGYNLYGTGTTRLGQRLEMDENNQATVFFSLSPVLRPGSYSLAVNLLDYYTPEINKLIDKQVGVGTFQIIERKREFFGVIDLGAKVFRDQNRVKNDPFQSISRGKLEEFLNKTEGTLPLEEASLLYELAKGVFNSCIVEVGSNRGRSAVALGRGSIDGNCVSVFAIEPHEKFTGVLGGEFGPPDRGAFYKAMLDTDCFHVVRLINASSEKIAPNWNKKIGLLWIDGDHTYEGVKRDFDCWFPHLVEDAMIAFDDSTNPDLGPSRLISEVMSSGEFEKIHQVGKVAVIKRRKV